MRKLIIPALLVMGFASCNKPAPAVVVETPIDTLGEQNKAIAGKFADAGAKGDTVGLEAIMADDIKIYGPGLNDSITKVDEMKFWKNGWKNEWESLTFDRAAIVAFNIPAGEKFPGDWVSDWGKWTVKQKNGKPTVSFWWNGVFKVESGKITTARAFYNMNDFFQQEGYTVTPPKAVKKK